MDLRKIQTYYRYLIAKEILELSCKVATFKILEKYQENVSPVRLAFSNIVNWRPTELSKLDFPVGAFGNFPEILKTAVSG